MKKFLIAAAPLALVAACSGGGGDVALQPGEWTMTTAMTDIEVPGMPEEMVAQMRESMGDQTNTETECISDEEAANPLQGMFSNNEMGENCDFGESSFEGGVININATCEAPGGQPGTATMAIEGTYTATTMDAEMSVNVEGGPMEMRMSGTMTGERTGECEA
jgi:hypothetical protein